MNANENVRSNAPEEAIVLGVASVETKGHPTGNEGVGGHIPLGISED